MNEEVLALMDETSLLGEVSPLATHSENGGGETTLTSASGIVVSQFQDPLGRLSKQVSTATGTSLYTYYAATAAAGCRGKLATLADSDNVTPLAAEIAA